MVLFLILVAIVLILIMMVVFLGLLAVVQIRMAGMKVVDFWSFVKANETLNKLYAFSKK